VSNPMASSLGHPSATPHTFHRNQHRPRSSGDVAPSGGICVVSVRGRRGGRAIANEVEVVVGVGIVGLGDVDVSIGIGEEGVFVVVRRRGWRMRRRSGDLLPQP
jgi:hypothetical protein